MARLDAYANAVKRGKARGVAPKEKPRVFDGKVILAVKRRIDHKILPWKIRDI